MGFIVSGRAAADSLFSTISELLFRLEILRLFQALLRETLNDPDQEGPLGERRHAGEQAREYLRPLHARVRPAGQRRVPARGG